MGRAQLPLEPRLLCADEGVVQRRARASLAAGTPTLHGLRYHHPAGQAGLLLDARLLPARQCRFDADGLAGPHPHLVAALLRRGRVHHSDRAEGLDHRIRLAADMLELRSANGLRAD